MGTRAKNKTKKTAGAFVGFFGRFFNGIKEGDAAVRLSLLIMGAGYFARKQYVKGILITIFQMVATAYTILVGVPYLVKFPTLGTVKRESVYDAATMKNVYNDYDHSFKILLFGIISIAILVGFLIIWMNNISSVRKLQLLKEQGKHINTFKEDVKDMFNHKFHITMLFMPCTGILAFTVMPLLVLIAIAFTNYDQQHMPPSELFTWVGFANFKQLFNTTASATFSYSFLKVLSWTIVWAILATFTTYIGGILLAMFINNKKTKCKKVWRTLFIITIAVPQFVSLLLIRYFLSDSGIVNTICSNIGLTDFLKSIGLVPSYLEHIPFFTNPGWAKTMIVLVNIWIGVPYQMLIATGILMNIPEDMYESARIDGANPFQTFRKITMPYMLFVTAPNLITQFVANINNFNVIYLLTQDVYKTMDQKLANSNAKEIDLLVTWLYRLTQEYYNYKMASVIGIMVFIVCAVFTLIAFSRTIKGDKEERFQL